MIARSRVEVAVVGAGIIGLASALRIAAGGREVVVVDPNEPGSGASYGNAGTLAPYACVPVGNPDLLRALPHLLLSADSPLAVRWAGLAALSPWLARFLRQSLPGRARANALALAGILKDAVPAWRELAAEAGAAALLRHEGCLYAFRATSDDDSGTWGAATRNAFGVRCDRLTAGQVAALEPSLPLIAGGGVLFPDAVHIVDPGALAKSLARALTAAKVSMARTRIVRIDVQSDGRIWLDGPELSLEARKIVIAAGAWSKLLALQAGDRIPLDTERGYHLEFATDAALLRRPVCPVDLGFYFTPMKGRLRVAGTVELAGLAAPANARRLAFLERKAREIFPELGAPAAKWLGFRPSLPDSLPVIGEARGNPNIVYAFGHGHLGMTLAAVTSRLVAGLVDGNPDPVALAPFAASRFGGWP